MEENFTDKQNVPARRAPIRKIYGGHGTIKFTRFKVKAKKVKNESMANKEEKSEKCNIEPRTQEKLIPIEKGVISSGDLS